MIRTTGESTPRSVANNPNYNPAIFGQGPKTDFLGRGLMERIQADAKKQRELEEALNPPGFIPIEARRPPSGGSDFRDVLNSMGYARGGKVVRQADGSLKSFNPVRLGGRDYYQEYMDRQSRPPQKAAAPKPLSNPDGSPTNLDPNRDFKRGYDRFIGSLRVDGGLDNSDKISIKNYLSRAVLGGQINPYFARELGNKSQLNTLNQNQKQFTDRQKFNLDTFQRAAPGSLFGQTAGMQPPVNLSFIGSQ